MRGGKIFTAALLTAKSVKFTYREKFQVYGSYNICLATNVRLTPLQQLYTITGVDWTELNYWTPSNLKV